MPAMKVSDSVKKQWIPLWVIPVMITMSIGTVWLRLFIVRTTYTINQSDKMTRNLQQEREHLELRLASMKSPRKLEVLARTRFNLSRPRSDQVVYIK